RQRCRSQTAALRTQECSSDNSPSLRIAARIGRNDLNDMAQRLHVQTHQWGEIKAEALFEHVLVPAHHSHRARPQANLSVGTVRPPRILRRPSSNTQRSDCAADRKSCEAAPFSSAITPLRI